MTGKLIVVTGSPGAGKTTISAMLAEQNANSAHIEGDAFFAFLRNGYVSPWEPESQAQNEMVVDATVAAAGTYAASGKFTVLDGVFGPWFIDRLKAAAEGAGATEIHYGILTVDLDTCLSRFGGRHGDDAPLDMVRTMHAQFADLGDYGDHEVSAASTPEACAAELVAKLDAGALRL